MAKKEKKQTSELLLALLFGVIAIAGLVTASSFNPIPTSLAADTLAAMPQTKGDNVVVETSLQFEIIHYATKTIYDASLPRGSTKIITAGIDGQKTVTYEITYTNGVVTNKKAIKQDVTKPAVNQVIAQGTHENANSTQPPTQPNPTSQPEPDPTPDPIPTGLCWDGTFTYSTTKYHACYHHGGIKEWYLS